MQLELCVGLAYDKKHRLIERVALSGEQARMGLFASLDLILLGFRGRAGMGRISAKSFVVGIINPLYALCTTLPSS